VFSPPTSVLVACHLTPMKGGLVGHPWSWYTLVILGVYRLTRAGLAAIRLPVRIASQSSAKVRARRGIAASVARHRCAAQARIDAGPTTVTSGQAGPPWPGRSCDPAESHRPPAAVAPSFEAFFLREQRNFLRLAVSRLRDRRDAEDAVLEAGRPMYQKWPRILAHANPIALTYRMLNGVVTDFYRRTARNRETPVAEAHDVAYLQELREHEALDLAMDALKASAPIQENCVRMRHLLQLPYEEIAEPLDITVGAARTNVSLGLQRLKQIMTSPHHVGEGGT
jgi:RNA polymerase sigma factor (sigma-70 family)